MSISINTAINQSIKTSYCDMFKSVLNKATLCLIDANHKDFGIDKIIDTQLLSIKDSKKIISMIKAKPFHDENNNNISITLLKEGIHITNYN